MLVVEGCELTSALMRPMAVEVTGVVVEDLLHMASVEPPPCGTPSYRLRSQWTDQDRNDAGGVSTLSTADAQVIAVAERHGLPVMTTDRAWLVIERLTGGFRVKVVHIR
ncbi:hypothetical protein [Streptomyces sp. JNUCC 63]